MDFLLYEVSVQRGDAQVGVRLAEASNDVTVDTDVGINVLADQATISNNKLVDTTDDDRVDVGIVNDGINNAYFNNRIIGFRTREHGVERGTSTPRRGQQIEE